MARGKKKDYTLVALRNIQNISNNKGYNEEQTAMAAAMTQRTYKNRKEKPHTLRLEEIIAFANHEGIHPSALLLDVYDADFLNDVVSVQRTVL